jgi:hypothetical protein
MQLRRSEEAAFRGSFHANQSRGSMGDRTGLMQDYDVENQFELGDLADDSDDGEIPGKRTSFDQETRTSNGLAGSGSVRVKKETVRSGSKSADR